MEEIRQAFADKNFDEKSLQLISNFIEEFDDLFGKYVPRDEVIGRIKENLDKIVYGYKFEKKKTLGQYDGTKKEMLLRDSDNEEEIKSVFFHEMIHCITRNQEKNVTAFSKMLQSEDLKDIEIVTCHGLTEGFTQYVTEKRNEKYAPELDMLVYPILAEQIENLAELLGEEEFLDIAFNRPDDLLEEMAFEYGEWDFEADEFLNAFDIIWREEEEIYKKKQHEKAKTKEDLLFEAIFGSIYDEPEEITEAKTIITNNLTRILMSEPITTVEKFNIAYWRICTYAEQLDLELGVSLFEELLGQVKNLQKSGKSMEEMLLEMPENLRGLVKLNQIFEDFEKVDKDGKIELLTQNEFLDRLYEDDILDSRFKKEFFIQMARSIITTYSQKRDYDLFNQLRGGLAQIIKDRGYNVDTLSLEDIDFDEVYGTSVFNLYSNTTEECVYLGTFMYDVGDFFEMSLCDDEKKAEIVSQCPEMNDGIIFITKSGKSMSYHGGEEYKLTTWNGIAKSRNITYRQSELEVWQQKLKQRIQRFERISQIPNVPDIIMKNSKKLVQDAIRIIEQIQNKSKILPEEIEAATGDITHAEIEAIMGNMTDSKEKRQEALERGIGYGEK